MEIGNEVHRILEELSKFSASDKGVTRLYLTTEHKDAAAYITELMESAGLKVHMDSVGNILGEYTSPKNTDKTLVIGSHQDTVRCGGKYDGILGVILPVITIKNYLKDNGELNYNLKIVAFGDEEGVRFSSIYLGSKALTGNLTEEDLKIRDEDGISVEEALKEFGLEPGLFEECRLKEKIDGYLEIHIEQGPVLEKEDLSVGIVSGIQGTERYGITIGGVAGHAGTVPMNLRSDACLGAAKFIGELNSHVKSVGNMVATVGTMSLSPGAINVIPERADFTLDIRSPDNGLLKRAMVELDEILAKICAEEGLSFEIKHLSGALPCECDSTIKDILRRSFDKVGIRPYELYSGAGHDAQEMKNITDMGMMFVRCTKGISHSPFEKVRAGDIQMTGEVLREFLREF